MRGWHTYQAALCVLFFAWRAHFGFAGAGVDNTFTMANLSAFAAVLKGTSWLQVLSATLIVAFLPGASKLAKAFNPFYALSEKLKKEKPHPEDDLTLESPLYRS